MEWNLLETKNETPETKTLRFLPKSKVLFKAGQYFIFYDMVSYLEDCRAYSASSVPGTDFVEITVKLVKNPHFSKHLHEMKKGDSIEVKGPHGSFFLDKTEHASELVLIGAGSGMAPLRSIMQYAQIHMPQTKTTIICSAKNESSVIYKKELEELEKKGKIQLFITLTQQEGKYTGRINKQFIQTAVSDIAKSLFFICGPQRMVDSVNEILKELGVVENRMRTESF